MADRNERARVYVAYNAVLDSALEKKIITQNDKENLLKSLREFQKTSVMPIDLNYALEFIGDANIVYQKAQEAYTSKRLTTDEYQLVLDKLRSDTQEMLQGQEVTEDFPEELEIKIFGPTEDNNDEETLRI